MLGPIDLDPSSTLVVVIDLQEGFASAGGTLGRFFGEQEVSPAISVVAELSNFLTSLPLETRVLLVVSEYPEGFHTGGDSSSPLASLCVPGNGTDCEIVAGLFRRSDWPIVKKTRTDAWTSLAFRSRIEEFLGVGGRTLIVGGLTATTCVLETVRSILGATREGAGRLIVARDLVAARASASRPTAAGPSRVDRAFAEMMEGGAIVVPSWRAICWTDGRRAGDD